MAKKVSPCFLTITAFVLLGMNCAQYLRDTFSFVPSLKDNRCMLEVQLFSRSGLTLLHCTTVCLLSKHQSCVGVVYKESQQVCYGCLRMNTTDFEPLAGTVFLKRLKECSQYLVQNVSDSQLSESSTFYEDGRWGAIHARLDIVEVYPLLGSWLPADTDLDPYIQVDFLDLRRVTGVVTQGRDIPAYSSVPLFQQWVTEYRVRTSSDCSTWVNVTDRNGAVEYFAGNTDMTTKVTNLFDYPVIARCVRIKPTQYNTVRSMRFDVLGCEHN